MYNRSVAFIFYLIDMFGKFFRQEEKAIANTQESVEKMEERFEGTIKIMKVPDQRIQDIAKEN